MGCDIHCWIEYRVPGGFWQLQKRSPCTTCNALGKLSEHKIKNKRSRKGECWRCGGTHYSELHVEVDDAGTVDERRYLYGGNAYHDRNYTVFGLLAGVRWTSRDPLYPERGVPDDCSPEYKQIVEEDGEDGHSHSWLTLTEVEAIVMCVADPLVVDQEEFEMIRANVKGEFWDGLVCNQMRPLAEKYGPENVRIVFHFDN